VRDEDSLFYAGAGPLAAIVLGIALTPLRGLTPASNLAFAFIALTIVVAELGGRGAALATALVSALSLDFFLTRPYLRLAIEDKHDAIAFVGLAVCGLIAASLAAHRRHRVATLAAAAGTAPCSAPCSVVGMQALRSSPS
jgi:K+-sensing histidine kinase KdpD